MPWTKTKWPWLIALILYGSTLYFSSNILLLLLLPMLFPLAKDIKALNDKKSTLLMVAFVVAGMLNTLFGFILNGPGRDGLRSLITMPLYLITIYLSRILEDFRVRKAIYFFIAVECIVGAVELYVGSPHPFPRQLGNDFADSSDLSGFESLYFGRAYGLSENSSVLALKVFILIIMLSSGDFRRFRTSARILFMTASICGLIATFNRTIISSLVVFVVLLLARNLYRAWRPAVFLLAASVLAFLVFSPARQADALAETASFGVKAGGLDARYVIWADAVDFIKAHPSFGNHSNRISFDYFGTDLHAHNSFLQMLATHGWIISAMLIAFVLVNISKSNFPIVVSIITYSLAQYGIFWAASFLDIVFYYHLVTQSQALYGQKYCKSPVQIARSS
jgi:O-antigen ligase